MSQAPSAHSTQLPLQNGLQKVPWPKGGAAALGRLQWAQRPEMQDEVLSQVGGRGETGLSDCLLAPHLPALTHHGLLASAASGYSDGAPSPCFLDEKAGFSLRLPSMGGN